MKILAVGKQPIVSLPRLRQHLCLTAATFSSHVSGTQTSQHGDTSPVLFRDYEVKLTKLPSGLTLASLDTMKEMSNMAMVFNGGTRYETPQTLGLTQRVRGCIGLTTKNLRMTDIGPLLAEMGGRFNVKYTREHLIISLQCPREFQAKGLEMLGELAQPVFDNTLVSDRSVDLDTEVDAAQMDPQHRIMEQLHRAAFGSDGLANQLVWPASYVRRHSTKAMRDFAAQYMTEGTGGFIGLGVSHQDVIGYATEHLMLPPAPNSQMLTGGGKAVFRGGEVRQLDKFDYVLGAIATEGASLKDIQGICAQMVLNSLLVGNAGMREPLRLESGPAVIPKALKAAGLEASINPVNVTYSDTGLFGIQFASDGETADKVLKVITGEFTKIASGNLSQEDFEQVRRRVSMQVEVLEQQDSYLMESMAVQVMGTGVYTTPTDVIGILAELKLEDVQRVAKATVNKKLALALTGDVRKVPYLGDLTKA